MHIEYFARGIPSCLTSEARFYIFNYYYTYSYLHFSFSFMPKYNENITIHTKP